MKALYPIALIITIFAASSSPDIAFPSTSLSYEDKIQHFFVFGLLATTIYRIPFFIQRPLLVIAITTLFGLSDEYHQIITPHRTFELLDLAADFLGSVTAVLAYRFLTPYRLILELNLAKFLKFRKTHSSLP